MKRTRPPPPPPPRKKNCRKGHSLLGVNLTEKRSRKVKKPHCTTAMATWEQVSGKIITFRHFHTVRNFLTFPHIFLTISSHFPHEEFLWWYKGHVLLATGGHQKEAHHNIHFGSEPFFFFSKKKKRRGVRKDLCCHSCIDLKVLRMVSGRAVLKTYDRRHHVYIYIGCLFGALGKEHPERHDRCKPWVFEGWHDYCDDPTVQLGFIWWFSHLFCCPSSIFFFHSGDVGLNPVWGEEIEWTINNKDLALIRFVVQDEDVFGEPNFLGQAVYPVNSLRTGNFANQKFPPSGEASCWSGSSTFFRQLYA